MMMQPYRQPALSLGTRTCFDPPSQPCDPPAPPRRPRIDVAIVLGMMLGCVGITIATVRMWDRAGHIDLGPRAMMTHPHGRRAPKPPPPAQTKPILAATATSQNAWVLASRDPKKLVARAEALSALALDITVVEVRLSASMTKPWLTDGAKNFWPTRMVPVFDDSHMTGFELRDIPRDSALRAIGLVDGDQVLSINGARFDDGSLATLDVLDIRKRGEVAIEVARGNHHLVFLISWQHGKSGVLT